MPLLSQIVRKYPTSDSGLTNDPIGGLNVLDPLTAASVMKLETFHEHGLPTRLLQLASQITASHERQLFPDVGTGLFPASPAQADGLTVRLASNVLQNQVVDPRGLLLVPTSGVGIGQWRLITDVVGSFTTSQVVQVHRSWVTGTVPVSSDSYELVADVAWAKKFTFGAEYSAVGTSNVVQVMSLLYDIGRSGHYPTPSLRVPYSIPDQLLVLSNTGVTVGALRANYARSRAETLETRGFFGLKLYIYDIPSGLTVDLWGGAT